MIQGTPMSEYTFEGEVEGEVGEDDFRVESVPFLLFVLSGELVLI